MKNDLKYRMYGLVPYNLSPIQQGIQFGHAVVEYSRNVSGIRPFEKIYNKWADYDKTFIVLNGGTTNNNPERFGTLNSHMQAFKNAGITLAEFYEPDLGDQLTAFVFIVDERVWDREKYPDFISEDSNIIDIFSQGYTNWVKLIGGEKNLFLRNYLRTFKLA